MKRAQASLVTANCAGLSGTDVVKRHDEAIGSWRSEGAMGPCPELGVVKCTLPVTK